MSVPGRGGYWLGVLCALAAAIGFSGKAILVKLAYQSGVDSITLLALRMALALPFFVAIAWWTGRGQRLQRADWAWLAGLGFLGYYLSSLLDFWGLQYISAGLERLILFLYPTFTVLLTAWVERRGIARPTWGAMAFCYAGIVLVFVQSGGTANCDLWLGAALVLASTLSYALYLVGAGRAIARLGSLRFTAYASALASVFTLLQFVAMRPFSALHLPWRVYELSAAMALFSTVLPVFLLSFAIRRLGAGPAALIGSVGPVSTLFLAYVWLGETLSGLQLAGAGLVLSGVLMISMGGKRP